MSVVFFFKKKKSLETLIIKSMVCVWQMPGLGSKLAQKDARRNRYVTYSLLCYNMLLSVL